MAVKNFKKSCCVSDITDNNKSSIEECVTSLKDTLRNGKEEDVLLVNIVFAFHTRIHKTGGLHV